MAPGTAIDLGILRDGKPETIHVTVGEFHNNGAEEAGNSGRAVSSAASSDWPLANLTPDVRQQFNVPDRVHGAVIQSVRPGSPADDAGLTPGDVILQVDRHPVEDADSLREPASLGAGRERRSAAGVGERRRQLPGSTSSTECAKRRVDRGARDQRLHKPVQREEL